MRFAAGWPLARVVAELAEHYPSQKYPAQCRCGEVPAGRCCWRRALLERRAELEARTVS